MNAIVRPITIELIHFLLPLSFHEIRDHCDMAGLYLGDVWNAVTAYRENEKRLQREQAVARVAQAAKEGTDIELSPNDLATAKLYARAKTINEINRSIDTLIKIRDNPKAKDGDRVRAAESLINRAIGPVEAPSSIPFATNLSQASPTEIIDALIEGVNTGAVSASFANTIKELLSAKVQSQKLEDMIASRSRTIEHASSINTPTMVMRHHMPLWQRHQ